MLITAERILENSCLANAVYRPERCFSGGWKPKPLWLILSEPRVRIKKSKRKATVEEIIKFGRRCAAHAKESISSLSHGDFLYDERGLPKLLFLTGFLLRWNDKA